MYEHQLGHDTDVSITCLTHVLCSVSERGVGGGKSCKCNFRLVHLYVIFGCLPAFPE